MLYVSRCINEFLWTRKQKKIQKRSLGLTPSVATRSLCYFYLKFPNTFKGQPAALYCICLKVHMICSLLKRAPRVSQTTFALAHWHSSKAVSKRHIWDWINLHRGNASWPSEALVWQQFPEMCWKGADNSQIWSKWCAWALFSRLTVTRLLLGIKAAVSDCNILRNRGVKMKYDRVWNTDPQTHIKSCWCVRKADHNLTWVSAVVVLKGLRK